MSSHILKLVIYELKKKSKKNYCRGLNHCAIPKYQTPSIFLNSVGFFERLKSASAVSSEELPPNLIQNLLPSRKNCRNLILRLFLNHWHDTVISINWLEKNGVFGYPKIEHYWLSRVCFEMTRQVIKTRCQFWAENVVDERHIREIVKVAF
jgi:hypothetical protein